MGKIQTLADTRVSTRLRLRIMATTDLHMQVLSAANGSQSACGGASKALGLARTATLIHQARREAQNTLLLDNGDFLCGDGNDVLTQVAGQVTHPMIEIMNQLGYDAATPGNHDFDHGLPYLQQAISAAKFPYTCANVRTHRPDGVEPLLAEFLILERDFPDQAGRLQRLRIGLTGFVPPNSIAQLKSNHCRLHTDDIIETAKRVVPQIRAAGVDLVIALAHSGLGEIEHVPNMENAAVPLAAIEGIDAVIAGHRHQVFPGPDWASSPEMDPQSGTVHGKPVVSAGFWGSHLGLIDLDLEKMGDAWSVTAHKVTARPVSTRHENGTIKALVDADPQVEDIMRPTHRKVTAQLAKPLGHSQHALHSFFALAAPSRAVQVIQRAQLWYTRELLEKAGMSTDMPMLSSACAFKTGGYGGPDNFTDTKAGDLSMAVIADLYPFPNRLEALIVTGVDIRNWLERAASVFNRALSGMAVDLKAPEVPAYLYETVLGLDYTIDLSRPAIFDQYGNRLGSEPGRILDLEHAGKPVVDNERYVLVTNSYRTGGGGAYPIAESAERLIRESINMQQVLVAYFQAHPSVEAPLDAHWRFAPLTDAVMRFRSAPRALDHLPALAQGEIRPAGRDAFGYQLFDLHL